MSIALEEIPFNEMILLFMRDYIKCFNIYELDMVSFDGTSLLPYKVFSLTEENKYFLYYVNHAVPFVFLYYVQSNDQNS